MSDDICADLGRQIEILCAHLTSPTEC